MRFFYPNIVYENVAELQVESLPYRAYTQGAASGGGAFVTSQSGGTNDDTTEADGAIFDTTESGGTNDDTTAGSASDAAFSNPIDSLATGNFSDTFDLPLVSGDGGWAFIYWFPQYNEGSGTGSGAVTITNQSTGEELYSDSVIPSYEPHNFRAYQVVDTGDVEGDTIEVDFSNASGEFSHSYGGIITSEHTHTFDWLHDHTIDIGSHTHSFDWLHEHDVDVPNHTHAPQPGVIEFGTETASGVDVVVNGSTVASNIGSGTFQETVDLSGELNTNAWNTVDIETDSIGRLIGTAAIDAYRQIGTGGN